MNDATNSARNRTAMGEPRPRTVLLTGATGYVGGRLLRRLEADHCLRVRCLARRPEALAGRTATHTEIARGDALDARSLERAMSGMDTAYYLIHSMGMPGDFESFDRAAAANFAAAARPAGLKQIIYLGGLGSGGDLSTHLASRQEVGDILRSSGVATVEFRASVVIGSGSASYETVRALAESFPVMIAPRWVNTAAQPIAGEDLVDYLVAALEHRGSAIFEVGGGDRVSYAELIREYARQRGLSRRLVPTPLLSPAASPPARSYHPGAWRCGRGDGRKPPQRNGRRQDGRARGIRDQTTRSGRVDRARSGQRGPRVRRHSVVGRVRP